MTTKLEKTIGVSIALIALGICIILGIMKYERHKAFNTEGFIGKSEIEIKDGQMTPEVLLAFGRLSDPQVSPDGKSLMYGVSYTSIEDNRSCRNIYISNLDGSEATLATRSGKSISNARWSKDGSRVAFLTGGQIWGGKVGRDRRIKAVRQLSNVPGGISEFSFSPDGKKVLYIAMTQGRVLKPVQEYADLPDARAYKTDRLMYRHWDHWTTEIPHSFIAEFSWDGIGEGRDILSPEEAAFELPTEPFGGLEEISWHPDSRHLAYSCRKVDGKEYAFSTNTEIYIYDSETGECQVIPMGGGYDTNPVWSPDGSKLCWISMEREGYEADKQRLMLADVEILPDGGSKLGEIRELSGNFKYNVAGPVWDDDNSHIWFNALAEGLQAIYCTDLEGNIVRKTQEDWPFDFGSPYLIKDGKIYTSWQSMDFPTELVAINGDKLEPVTLENEHILSRLKEHRCEKRMIKTVDGKDMLTWVMLPPDFDENKVYPAIEICLGGPQGTISQSWSYRWNYRLMCSQGYVVVLPNRRGTTAFGQEWCEQIAGDYCGLNMQDYLVAAKELKDEPYVGKMGACGASYGGYSVYYLCGIHENVYDAFIAHAGIFNQEHMYMTTEEMWFPQWDNGGAPWDDNATARRHYANSPHKLIHKWHTPLMVIHGGTDFRVPYDQGMAAFNCAQMMGVPSELLVFPEENHWILKPQNALYWHRSYFSWLDKWLKD